MCVSVGGGGGFSVAHLWNFEKCSYLLFCTFLHRCHACLLLIHLCTKALFEEKALASLDFRGWVCVLYKLHFKTFS